jgi:hypothetical protein
VGGRHSLLAPARHEPGDVLDDLGERRMGGVEDERAGSQLLRERLGQPPRRLRSGPIASMTADAVLGKEARPERRKTARCFTGLIMAAFSQAER